MKFAITFFLSLLVCAVSFAQVSQKEKEFGVTAETKNNALNELYLADRLYEDKSYYETYEILLRVAKADPVILNTYENLYRVSVKLNKYNNEVIDCFLTAKKIYTDNCEINFFLAELLSHRKEYEKALAEYDNAITIQNKNKIKSFYTPYFYSSRGFCHIQLASFSLAEKDYSNFLEIYPRNMIGLLNRGYCYYKLGDIEKAKQDWEVASNFGSTEAKAFLNKFTPYK